MNSHTEIKSYRSQTGVHNEEFGLAYYASLRPEMAALLPEPAGAVLDVGCGTGVFARSLRDRGLAKEVWGVEINTEAAEAASKVLDKVLVGDVSRLMTELPRRFFDAVYFNDSLEHMEDPFSVLKEIKKHLKPGGYVMASLPNVRYIRNLFELLFKKDWKYQDHGVLDRTHLRFFTQKSARRMFEEAGLVVEISRGIEPSQKWYMKVLNILTAGWLEDTLYLQFIWRTKV